MQKKLIRREIFSWEVGEFHLEKTQDRQFHRKKM
jgi:hypothetical protein